MESVEVGTPYGFYPPKAQTDHPRSSSQLLVNSIALTLYSGILLYFLLSARAAVEAADRPGRVPCMDNRVGEGRAGDSVCNMREISPGAEAQSSICAA